MSKINSNSIPGETPVPGLQTTTFSLCLHVTDSTSNLAFPFTRILTVSNQNPILITSFNLTYFLTPNTVTLEG